MGGGSIQCVCWLTKCLLNCCGLICTSFICLCTMSGFLFSRMGKSRHVTIYSLFHIYSWVINQDCKNVLNFVFIFERINVVAFQRERSNRRGSFTASHFNPTALQKKKKKHHTSPPACLSLCHNKSCCSQSITALTWIKRAGVKTQGVCRDVGKVFKRRGKKKSL